MLERKKNLEIMRIEINNEREIDISEQNLIVKDKKLFNTSTKSFEGLDGDVVTFINGNMKISGTVDGYTHNGIIKIRGVEKPYVDISEITSIDHISVITASEDESKTVVIANKEVLD